jgi:hypothetical protein
VYRVTPPRPAPGETVDYRLELRRDGQCLATLPVDGSWSTLIGATAPGAREPDNAQAPVGFEHFGTRPLWTHRLEYFATVIAELRAEVIGATPDGYRVNFSCENGRLRGPTIDAVEVEGTDYVCVRPDGIAELHKIATWRTSEGALILEEGSGVTDLGPDGYGRIARGAWTGDPPTTMASCWSTADPAWQWLTRVETVAIGRTIASNLQLRLDVYIPALDGGSSDA